MRRRALAPSGPTAARLRLAHLPETCPELASPARRQAPGLFHPRPRRYRRERVRVELGLLVPPPTQLHPSGSARPIGERRGACDHRVRRWGRDRTSVATRHSAACARLRRQRDADRLHDLRLRTMPKPIAPPRSSSGLPKPRRLHRSRQSVSCLRGFAPSTPPRPADRSLHPCESTKSLSPAPTAFVLRVEEMTAWLEFP